MPFDDVDEADARFEAREENAEGRDVTRVLAYNRRQSGYNPERAEPPRLKCVECFNFLDECVCPENNEKGND